MNSEEKMQSSNEPYSTPTSSMAIISLIAGILGITFFPTVGSVIALITGYMARKEIDQSSGSLGGQGLATAGIVLGWIGIALGCCIILFVLLIFASVFGTTIFAINQSTWLLPHYLLTMV
jgi:hypothetical protein